MDVQPRKLATSNLQSQKLNLPINPAVLSPHDAGIYIGINSKGDPLKSSRSTGILWGVPAPEFIKAGDKKILYRVYALDEFLDQFQSYSNNAQVGDSQHKAQNKGK